MKKRNWIIISFICLILLGIVGSMSIPLLVNGKNGEISIKEEKSIEPVKGMEENIQNESDQEAIDDLEKKQEIGKYSEQDKEQEEIHQIEEKHKTNTEKVAVKENATTQSNNKGNEVKDQWVQEQIDRNRDKINEKDLATGSAIYNKLDTNYINNLISEGLTPENKALLKNYITSTISTEEYDTAMKLYNEYIGLVE